LEVADFGAAPNFVQRQILTLLGVRSDNSVETIQFSPVKVWVTTRSHARHSSHYGAHHRRRHPSSQNPQTRHKSSFSRLLMLDVSLRQNGFVFRVRNTQHRRSGKPWNGPNANRGGPTLLGCSFFSLRNCLK